MKKLTKTEMKNVKGAGRTQYTCFDVYNGQTTGPYTFCSSYATPKIAADSCQYTYCDQGQACLTETPCP